MAVRWRLRPSAQSALRVLGILSLAGALSVFVVGPPSHPSSPPQSHPPHPPTERPPEPSPTETTPDSPPSPLRLPDGFPETAGPYILESIREEASTDGLLSYFSARYTAGEGEAISVRLVGFDPQNAAAFTKSSIQTLENSASIENVRLPDDLPIHKGESVRLFARNGAGIFLMASQDRLLIVAAPDPHAALTVGRSLVGR